MFPPESLPSLPLTIPQAFARMEGWYARGQVPNRPQRNNNPGDLEFGPFAQKFGASSGDPRFAIFPTAQDGWTAHICLFGSPEYEGLTIEEAVNKFAPAPENNVEQYTACVCFWTGKQPTDLVSS